MPLKKRILSPSEKAKKIMVSGIKKAGKDMVKRKKIQYHGKGQKRDVR